MDKTIRKYTDFDEMKADEYRYWQSRPVHERVAAIWQLTEDGYRMKGGTGWHSDFRELLSALND